MDLGSGILKKLLPVPGVKKAIEILDPDSQHYH
jgi:hypothetical protein